MTTSYPAQPGGSTIDTTPQQPATATTTQPTAHGLPVTGADITGLAAIGLGAAIFGAAAVRWARAGR